MHARYTPVRPILRTVSEMNEKSIFANLVREPDGAVSAVYGAYRLQSALQPLFCEDEDGNLHIEAFEGWIRASFDGIPCPPPEFFRRVPEADRAAVDSLCRSLHILNAGALRRDGVGVIVNIEPHLFAEPQALRQEIDRLRLTAREAGLQPDRIACKIRERSGDDASLPDRVAARLHAGGFSVAIDEYAGEDRDLDRLRRLEPQLVSFDTSWLRSFTRNPAGLALVRVVIGQFEENGIRAIVSGIETQEQIDLCHALGSPLMQGYLLAGPELAPTGFDLRFPEPALSRAGRPAAGSMRSARPARQFGRRRASV